MLFLIRPNPVPTSLCSMLRPTPGRGGNREYEDEEENNNQEGRDRNDEGGDYQDTEDESFPEDIQNKCNKSEVDQSFAGYQTQEFCLFILETSTTRQTAIKSRKLPKKSCH